MKRKRNLKKLAALCMLLSQPAAHASGLLFNVNATGTPGNVDITLCLNGRGPLSCQHYIVSALSLSITTVPNHSYPDAGIIINTPGFTLANLGIECTLIQNGYCLFSVSNTQPATITISNGEFNPFLTAAGQDSTTTEPLLVVSTDSGTNWSAINSLGFSTGSVFNATSCTGGGTTAICTAAGQDSAVFPSTPILAALDTTGNWTSKTVSGVTQGLYDATSCTGSGSSAICIVVGDDEGDPNGIIAVSTNGAVDWSTPTLGDTGRNLFAASCTGSGSTAVCVAAGEDHQSNNSGAPFLAISTNGGTSWSSTDIGTDPGIFRAVSCSGAICVAAGQDDNVSPSAPIIAFSNDGGHSFSQASTPNLPTNAILFAASCTDNGALCVVAGEDSPTSGNSAPVLAVSTDGGASWSLPTITGAPAVGRFVSASCTGSGISAICSAAGIRNNSPFSLLAVGTNGGSAWEVKTVSGEDPNGGFYRTTSCTGNGSSAICIAGGFEFGGPPFLALSTDGASTWSKVVSASFPANGVFNGSAASAGLIKMSPKKLGIEKTLEKIIKT